MASADYQVLTPERVNLQYDIAGLGSRGAAAIVDTALQMLALVVVGLGLLGLVALTRSATTVAIVVGVLALTLVTLGYFPLFEILWNGQTPGKRLVGVRVVRENGYPIRPADAVIRNVVRILDGLPVLYAIGVITMLLNSRSKRLGDFAAGTLVVREGVRSPARFAVGAEAAFADSVIALQPADATLVRDFLVRRSSMHPASRADLARRLATSIAARYGLHVADPDSFLENLNA